MSSGRSCRGGKIDLDDVEAIVEVFAELSLLGEPQQVAIGGGDDADVDLDGLRPADALESAFLEHAQQFGLHGQRDLADLVEKDRAAVRQLEPALALTGRAGERPLLVAEELAFEQRLRQGRAIDGDERGVRGAAMLREWPGPPVPCRCRSRRRSTPC